MPSADGAAAVRALGEAGALSEDAGRHLDGCARDLEDLSSASARAWTGRSGAQAGRRIDADAMALQALSGVLLFLGDVLRVEGDRLGRALQSAAAEADDPETVAEMQAVVDGADRALADRLMQAAHALLEPDLADQARAPADLVLDHRILADPRRLAEVWHRLDPITRQQLTHADPELAAADGLPAAERDVLNRRRLDDLVDAGVRPADLGALSAHLEADPHRMLLDVTSDGRSVVTDGNPDRARQVMTFVPGTGSNTADIGRSAQRAAAVCRAAEDTPAPAVPPGGGQASGEPGCVAVTWQGYDAPDDVREAATTPALAERYATGLAGLTAGLDAVDRLDGRDAPATAVGYSYGSTVVGRAAATEQGLAVDRMVHVGSPGAGTPSLLDQRITGGGPPRTPFGPEVVGVWSRWDPVPLWSRSGVLGGLPGSEDFGGVPVRVDTGGSVRQRWQEHSRYFDEGTASLQVIGDLVVDPPR